MLDPQAWAFYCAARPHLWARPDRGGGDAPAAPASPPGAPPLPRAGAGAEAGADCLVVERELVQRCCCGCDPVGPEEVRD